MIEQAQQKKEAHNQDREPKLKTGTAKMDPLHGVTLKMMLEELQQSLGWQGLGERININCFKNNPSLKSSLTFLRRTPWAREKVEQLYVKQKGLKPARKRATHAKPSDNPWVRNKL